MFVGYVNPIIQRLSSFYLIIFCSNHFNTCISCICKGENLMLIYSVKFDIIKAVSNIRLLNHDATQINSVQFEEELKAGYRAGIIIIPVDGAPQMIAAMTTPYHQDKYEIDPGFLIENYKEFCRLQSL